MKVAASPVAAGGAAEAFKGSGSIRAEVVISRTENFFGKKEGNII